MPEFDINDPANFLPFVGAQPQGINPELRPEIVDYASLLGLGQAPQLSLEPQPQPDLSQAVPLAPQSQPQPKPDLIKAGGGAGVSVAGYNPAANAAIKAGPGKKLDRDIAAERATVEAQFDPL